MELPRVRIGLPSLKREVEMVSGKNVPGDIKAESSIAASFRAIAGVCRLDDAPEGISIGGVPSRTGPAGSSCCKASLTPSNCAVKGDEVLLVKGLVSSLSLGKGNSSNGAIQSPQQDIRQS